MSAEQELLERLQAADEVKPSAPSEGSAMEIELAKEDKNAGQPVTLRNLFTHHDAHPIVLNLALLKAFGVDWLDWEWETLWSEIKRIFKTQISEHSKAKIQAVSTLYQSTAPWDLWQVFEKVCQALNNNIPRADIVQACGTEQLFVAVDIMNRIKRLDFSPEVRAYMAACFQNDDVLFAPPPLDFIQAELSQPYWECLDCGNVDSALFHDGICDTCTEKFDPERNLSMRPDPELLKKGLGKNVKLRLKFNPDPIEKRWNAVKKLPSKDAPLDETQEDVQVAKLLVDRDYLNIRRRQLIAQLVALRTWMSL
jgi:hypothetical protein